MTEADMGLITKAVDELSAKVMSLERAVNQLFGVDSPEPAIKEDRSIKWPKLSLVLPALGDCQDPLSEKHEQAT